MSSLDDNADLYLTALEEIRDALRALVKIRANAEDLRNIAELIGE